MRQFGVVTNYDASYGSASIVLKANLHTLANERLVLLGEGGGCDVVYVSHHASYPASCQERMRRPISAASLSERV
jgi:hypothetical protein